jgi:hypothetical protein
MESHFGLAPLAVAAVFFISAASTAGGATATKQNRCTSVDAAVESGPPWSPPWAGLS